MRFSRLQSVRQPPLWSYVVVAVAPVAGFVLAFPVGLDIWPDIVIEGLYLLFGAAILIPLRRLRLGILEVGWQVFVLGRFFDFLDELFVEPEPLVEPYLSGLLMVLSMSITLAGAYALLGNRSDRIESLEEQTADLSLKNDAIDAAPIGVTIADMIADDEPLTYVNHRFEQMTGYDTEEAVGDNCRYLQGERTDPEQVAQLREAIDAREATQVTVRNYRQDGTEFWNEVTLAPIDTQNGVVSHYVGFQQDVTERVEYRQRLQRQRDDLELLNEMFRHDVRNDLQLIVANAELLGPHVDDEGTSRLGDLQKSAREAVELTETAEDLSRAMLSHDSGGQRIVLSDSIDRVIETIRSEYSEASVTIDEPPPDVAVAADEMLDSVFRNLVENAIQHNDKAVPEVTLTATRTGDSVVIRIADNGPGLPEQLRDELFSRGESAGDSGGTGIGTYLVDRLVTRYGGDVWAEANEPAGAVFIVSLPTVE